VAVTGDNKVLWPHSKSENAGSNKVVLWLINCAIFNSFLVHKNRNQFEIEIQSISDECGKGLGFRPDGGGKTNQAHT
jgi:hypothetical protein